MPLQWLALKLAERGAGRNVNDQQSNTNLPRMTAYAMGLRPMDERETAKLANISRTLRLEVIRGRIWARLKRL